MSPSTPQRIAAFMAALASCLAFAAEPTTSPTTPIAPQLLGIAPSQFKPLKNHPDQYYYLAPGVDLRQYRQIMVAPLVILDKAQGQQWQALVSDENGQAAQRFQTSMRQALQARGLAVTDTPGPGVLILRVAVTNIEQRNEGFTVTDVLPIKMVFNLARRASGLEKIIVKISTLGQLNDAQTGVLVAGGYGLRAEDKAGASAVSLQTFQPWLEKWSREVADRLADIMPTAAPVAP